MDNICIDCRNSADCKRKPRTDQWTVAGCSWFEADPVITNSDRIRSMTDEELAEWLSEVAGWIAPYEGRVHPLLEWLKAPVEEGEG